MIINENMYVALSIQHKFLRSMWHSLIGVDQDHQGILGATSFKILHVLYIYCLDTYN
jgi:hypothetical protein